MNKALFLLLLGFTPSISAQPDWVKSAIWYQIFPERFCNGDTGNDPTLKDQWGSWPHDTTGPWQIHPWTSDWYMLQPWEQANGKGYSFNITRRRYGGDIQGIINKIGYLKNLGVNTLYLNPLFMAPSHHKYDGALYHHIDPNFGPDPNGDRALMQQENPLDPATWVWTSADRLALKMIDTLHKSGFRLIFDGVFNHMGITSFAFQDVVKNREKSAYANWFTIHDFGNVAEGKELKYEGWFGVKDLPEIREDEQGIVSGPKEYIFASTRRWMDPDGDGNPRDGIDGWRLDVAFCVKHAFWKDWRKVVKNLNPQAYLTAEVIDSVSKVRPYLEGDEFDAIMNYNFGFTLADFFIGENTISPTQLDNTLRDLRNAYQTDPYLMMNLFDSHDTNRMASHVVNQQKVKYSDWGKYFGWSKAENPDYQTRKPNAEERKIQHQILAFMMMYPGAPMLYYGTEAGMWGANDPDCRKPMVWEEYKYEQECTDARGKRSERCDDPNFDAEFFAFCRQLIGYRNNFPALQKGSYKTIVTDNQQGIFAFERRLDDQVWMCFFHTGNQTARIELPASNQLPLMFDALNNRKVSAPDGRLILELQPSETLILRSAGE
jgi:cyclomaltodextrinase / maltogenic alpha-amylase / neopullulanase